MLLSRWLIPSHKAVRAAQAPVNTQAYTYFSTLYPTEQTADLSGYLGICHQDPAVKDGSMPTIHLPISNPEKLAREAIRISSGSSVALPGLPPLVSEGRNVWNSICAHAEDLGSHRRGKRAEVTLLPALWIDIDIAGPGHAANNLPRDVTEVVEGLLVPFGLDPTMLVHSGGGLHAYWCLDKIAQVDDANRGSLQELLQGLYARFAALASGRGWHLDNVSDLARVLRPAGTLNRKPGREPPPVSLLLAGGPRYTLDTLNLRITGSAELPRNVTFSSPSSVLPPAELWTYDATKAEVLGKIKRSSKPERVDTFRAILSGLPFAAPGDRNRAAYQLASWLSFYCPDGDPEAIADILQPSLDRMRLEAPNPDDYLSRDEMLVMIERCLVDGRGKAAASKSSNERLAATLVKSAKPLTATDSNRTTNPKAEGVVPQSPETGRHGAVPPDSAPSMASGTVGSFPPVIEGLAAIILAALIAVGQPQTFEGICTRIDRVGHGDKQKVKGALDVLVTDGRAHLIWVRGQEKKWAAGPKPPEPTPEPEETGEISNINAFSMRWTNRDDLVVHGREQYEASGIGPKPEGWQDDPDTYLAAMALHQTIITTPAGDKFLAMPRATVPGREYIPIAKGEVELGFWRDIKIVPDIWKKMRVNGKGEIVEKTFRQVLGELSIPSIKWLYDGLTQISYVDDKGIFHQRCWEPEDIEPLEDAQCDEYLKTWGEDNYARICDWFKHLSSLNQPSTMLVLQGDSGDGKDLLVKAASSQYRRIGGAVTGNLATDQFNADLSECPVVGCSEMLPSDWRGTSMNSGTLRDIITKQDHDVNEKNTRRVKLLGHLRWILTTNEPNFFPTREILSQASQEAILKRLVVVEAPRLPSGITAPKSFLTSRGGFDFTRDWIDGDNPRMVRHVRYIMENHAIRYPCPEGRFGVASFAGTFRERLAVNTQLSSLIVDGLLRFLIGEPSRKQLIRSVRVGSGKVLVQIAELHKQWASLVALGEGAGGSDRIDSHRTAPPAKAFAEEVSQRLSTRDDELIEGKTYKAIRVELLINHASALGVTETLAEVLKLTPEEFSVKNAAVKSPGIFGKS